MNHGLSSNKHIGIEHLISQLPGYVFFKEDAKHYAKVNHAAAELIGYSEPEQLIGKTEYNMRCPAAEFADDFIQQNETALSGNRLKIIDIHYYANNQLRMLHVNKFPIKDNSNNTIGLMIHAIEANDVDSLQLGWSLIKNKLTPRKSSMASYKIHSSPSFAELTEREFECLYLSIHGKSAAEIAAILHLSARTTEHYFSSMKIKLNLNKKSELIEWGIANGVTSTIPKRLLSHPLSKIIGRTC